MKKQWMIIPWLSLSLLLLGMLETFCSEFSFEKEWEPDLLFTIFLAGIVTFLVLQLKRRFAVLSVIGFVLGTGGWAVLRQRRLINDLQTILYYVNKKSKVYTGTIVSELGSQGKGETDGSFALLLLGFILLLYIAVMVFRLRRNVLGMLPVGLVVSFGMVFGRTPDIRAMGFLFCGSSLALGWNSYQETARGKGFQRVQRKHERQLLPAGVCLAVLILIGSFGAYFVTQKTQNQILSHAKKALEQQHKVERKVKRSVQEAVQLVRGKLGLDSDGRLSNSAPYYTGKTVMKITVPQKPESDVYLRGFIGGSYQNGKWNQPSGEELEKLLGSKENCRQMKSMDYQFFAMNTYEEFYDFPISDISSQGIDIRYTGFGKMSRYAYTPYFTDLMDVDDETFLVNGDGGIQKKSDEMYVKCYLMSLTEIQNLCLATVDYEAYRWYVHTEVSDKLLRQYLKYSGKRYTEMPKQGLEDFCAFADSYDIERCTKNDYMPKSEKGRERILENVVNVKNILGATATYSKELGEIPEGQDYVEYFLLKEKRGYCEHFATAGTLLLRQYGIPARYVSGYRVSPDAFQVNEDGFYTAKVLDSDAHAWSEFLYSTLGWIPAEMTPSAEFSKENYSANAPATVAPTLIPKKTSSTAGKETKTERKKSQKEVTAKPSRKAAPTPSATERKQGSGQMDGKKVFFAIIGLLFVLWCCFLLFQRMQRRRATKRLERLECRPGDLVLEQLSCFHWFMQDCGIRGADLQEEAIWLGRLCEEAKLELSPEEQLWICRLLQKAAFSKTGITEGECEKFTAFVGNAQKQLYATRKKVRQCWILLLGWKIAREAKEN